MKKTSPSREEKEEDRMAEETMEDRLENPKATPKANRDDPLTWLMEEEDRMVGEVDQEVDQMMPDLLDLDTPMYQSSNQGPIAGPSTTDAGPIGNQPPGTEDLLGLGDPEGSGSGNPDQSDDKSASSWTEGMFPTITLGIVHIVQCSDQIDLTTNK